MCMWWVRMGGNKVELEESKWLEIESVLDVLRGFLLKIKLINAKIFFILKSFFPFVERKILKTALIYFKIFSKKSSSTVLLVQHSKRFKVQIITYIFPNPNVIDIKFIVFQLIFLTFFRFNFHFFFIFFFATKTWQRKVFLFIDEM